jgi:hypothetical protein
MKKIFFFLVFNAAAAILLHGQNSPNEQQRKEIVALIEQYSAARESMDTVLLKSILVKDVDQLVSNGEWRNGISSAVKGMLKSSTSNPGTRTLIVDKLRMLNAAVAIADCRYEIQNSDGTIRKMWSSFVVVKDNKYWKISAIRNMLPASQ